MTRPTPEMACAVCLIPLNTLGDTYIHPIGFRTAHRHQPSPVPVTSLDTVRRTCDFCSDPYPIWALIGGDLAAVVTSAAIGGGLVQDFGDRWASCAPCYQHIRQHRLDRLTERALRALPTFDPAARSEVAELHQQFLAELQPGRTLITTTAWPATTTTARDLPRIRDRLIGFLRGPITLPSHLAVHRDDLADRLERARLYWVDATFTDLAATAASSLPALAVHPDLIPGAAGLLAWAAPIGDTAAVSWTTNDSAIHVIRYRSIGGGLNEQVLQTVRQDLGWLAPFATHALPVNGDLSENQQARSAPTLATWLLMGQRAAETPALEINRSTRKRYARENRPLPDIRLVRLRSTDQAPPGVSRPQGQAERVVPAERVWVTGHWRSQPYGPGRALRRPTYIHPFLRGPDDAPIKLSTTVRVLADGPDRQADG